MGVAEFVEAGEHLRMQLRDQVQNPGFDVVHFCQIRELAAVAFDRALLEFGERIDDLSAVVGLPVIFGHPDPAVPDVQAVLNRIKLAEQTLRVRGQRCEGLGSGVVGEVVPEGAEAA